MNFNEALTKFKETRKGEAHTTGCCVIDERPSPAKASTNQLVMATDRNNPRVTYFHVIDGTFRNQYKTYGAAGVEVDGKGYVDPNSSNRPDIDHTRCSQLAIVPIYDDAQSRDQVKQLMGEMGRGRTHIIDQKKVDQVFQHALNPGENRLLQLESKPVGRGRELVHRVQEAMSSHSPKPAKTAGNFK